MALCRLPGAAARGRTRRRSELARRPRCSADAAAVAPAAPRTQSLLQTLPQSGEAGGAGGAALTWDALQRADAAWTALRSGAPPPPAAPFVVTSAAPLPPPAADEPPAFDVAVCGGTLGVVLAAALSARGLRVAVVERGELRGRAQDWNASRAELSALTETGVVEADELEALITAEFASPGRAAFHGSLGEVLVRDVLNIGVSPDAVVSAARRTLERHGGAVFERTPLERLTVHPDGVAVELGAGRRLRARLAVDCLGHASPIARQARGGAKPDGVCLVVGSCARGFEVERNAQADVIVTTAALQEPAPGMQQQLFWEAFPAGSGPGDRTTYMFTYVDADPGRPSLTAMLESYWAALEEYQGVRVDNLQLLRVLVGAFPTYRNSPLRLPFARVLAVGDASGIQSPLSFGGFGALLRHLPRYSAGIEGALRADCLSSSDLGLINPYFPNLSAAWLFARAMSAPRGTRPAPEFVNNLLGTNFGVMSRLGDDVLLPFLRDVPNARGLALTLGSMMLNAPQLIPAILVHVGPAALLDWARHYAAMVAYTGLAAAGAALRPLLARLSPRMRWRAERWIDAWVYGSGLDFISESGGRV